MSQCYSFLRHAKTISLLFYCRFMLLWYIIEENEVQSLSLNVTFQQEHYVIFSMVHGVEKYMKVSAVVLFSISKQRK